MIDGKIELYLIKLLYSLFSLVVDMIDGRISFLIYPLGKYTLAFYNLGKSLYQVIVYHVYHHLPFVQKFKSII
jgi:hypothetical protein